MDGIAICRNSLKSGTRTFRIEGCQHAGKPAQKLYNLNNCIEVMTGAPLPKHTDAVVKFEDLEFNSGSYTLLDSVKEVDFKQNIHRQGSDSLKGHEVIPTGSMMNSPRWAIAASIGQSKIVTIKKPRIDILSTGDELVSIGEQPLPHQIRLSNPSAIYAALLQNGFENIHLSHVSDSKDKLLEILISLLEKTQCLIISGGVSAGRFDYVPGALTDLKTQRIFHKVRQKPGKPLWFGISQRKQPIFGLPGNPVASLLCFYRYVLPSLSKSTKKISISKYARLEEDISFSKKMTFFAPVACKFGEDAITYAKPIRSQGSGDFVALNASDGFLELPENQSVYRAGTCYPLYTWRS